MELCPPSTTFFTFFHVIPSSLRSVENVDAYEPVVTEQSVKEAEERLAYLNNRLGAKAEFKGSLFKPLILPDNVIVRK